jgi:predicted enzyme related to lactoylglutathione lyase
MMPARDSEEETVADWNGRFVWYELMTTDVPEATRFYGEVIGWSVRDSGRA